MKFDYNFLPAWRSSPTYLCCTDVLCPPGESILNQVSLHWLANSDIRMMQNGCRCERHPLYCVYKCAAAFGLVLSNTGDYELWRGRWRDTDNALYFGKCVDFQSVTVLRVIVSTGPGVSWRGGAWKSHLISSTALKQSPKMFSSIE